MFNYRKILFLILVIVLLSILGCKGVSKENANKVSQITPQSNIQQKTSNAIKLCGDWPGGNTIYIVGNDEKSIQISIENGIVGVPTSSAPSDLPSYVPLYPNGKIVSVNRGGYMQKQLGENSQVMRYSKVFMCTDDSVKTVMDYYANYYKTQGKYFTGASGQSILQQIGGTSSATPFHKQTTEVGIVRTEKSISSRVKDWIDVFAFNEPSGKTVIEIWPNQVDLGE